MTYTPDSNFSGSDQFTYQVEDAEGVTDQATVTVTVSEGDALDYELVRVHAHADLMGYLKVVFVVRNNRNRELGPVTAELYVGAPNAGDPDMASAPDCTMSVSDDAGHGPTTYVFNAESGCPRTLDDADQLPAEYVVAVRLVDDSPDIGMATIKVRKVWRVLRLWSRLTS